MNSPSPAACDCGAVATSHRTLCGIRARRCSSCTTAAEHQERADIAAAIASDARWLGEPRRHDARARAETQHLASPQRGPVQAVMFED